MKYLVVESINTSIDACAHHDSGIATCSDGGGHGVPWIFEKSKLLDSKSEAEKLAEMLCQERHKELEEYVFEKNGWYIGTSCINIKNAKMYIGGVSNISLFLCKDVSEDEILQEWLYNYEVLEVDV